MVDDYLRTEISTFADMKNGLRGVEFILYACTYEGKRKVLLVCWVPADADPRLKSIAPAAFEETREILNGVYNNYATINDYDQLTEEIFNKIVFGKEEDYEKLTDDEIGVSINKGTT